MIYVWVGIAGAIGAMLRYSIGVVFFSDSPFPFATLTINLVGSYVLAKLVSFAIEKGTSSSDSISIIASGFLGSFTTFSAVSVETVALFYHGRAVLGVLYIAISIVGGIMLSRWGLALQKGENVT